MSVCFLPFAGTSRQKISAASCEFIFHLFKSYSKLPAKLMDIKKIDPTILELLLPQYFEMERPKVLVGGEHLLTYFNFLYMKKMFSSQNLKLIVFDAHHDAYPNETLSHYSFIDWLIEKHSIEVMIIGMRYELEKKNNKIVNPKLNESLKQVQTKIKEFIGHDPFYLSIDVDVLEPSEFAHSAFPVESGLSIEEFEILFNFCLSLRPIFTDFVEFGVHSFPSIDTTLSRSLKWIEKAYLASECTR